MTVAYKIKPWAHQLAAIERAVPKEHFGLLFEVGCGKTSCGINILRHWYTAQGRLMRTLVLSPPITLQNWRREWAAHSDIDPRLVTVLDGAGVLRQEAVETIASVPGLGQIFITNYETVLMDGVFEALLKWGVEVLVCDEAHRLKNLQAKRTRAVFKLSDKSTKRLILTGTPILNTPLDLFAQWRILDQGETFGENFYQFRARYFWDKNAGMPKHKYFPQWIPKPDSFAELNIEIAKNSMAVKKADCLDLPPLVKKRIDTPLGKEQRRLYDEVKRDFIAFLEETAGQPPAAIVATLAITKALRLMEICSGFATIEGVDGAARTKKSLAENPRAEALRDLLAELAEGHKIIVWAVFKENYAQVRSICAGLGLDMVEVHGEVTPKAKQAAVDRFNTDPACRVFLGHPGSGGIGINLVASDVSIVYSRTFNLEHDIQSEARNYRGGSEIHAKVTRIDLVAPGTLEEEICRRLAEKQVVSDAVLRSLGGVL